MHTATSGYVNLLDELHSQLHAYRKRFHVIQTILDGFCGKGVLGLCYVSGLDPYIRLFQIWRNLESARSYT